MREQQDELPHARYGLLLGTGRIDSTGGVWPVYAARIRAAIALYRAGIVEQFVLSGYRDGEGRAAKRYDEIADMREDLAALGVPLDRMIEDVGFRTRDSIEHVGCIVGRAPVIMISQAAHLARAVALDRASGRRDIGFIADDPPSLATTLVWTEFLSRFKAIGDIVPMLFARLTMADRCVGQSHLPPDHDDRKRP